MLKRIIKDRLFGNSLWLLSSSIMVTLLGFGFWTINAHLFPPEEVGIATAVITAVELIVSLSILGFDVSLIKYLPVTRQKERLLGLSFGLSGALSFVVTILFVIFVDIVSPELSMIRAPLPALFFLAFVVFTLGFKLIDSVFIAQGNSRYVFYKDLIFSTVKIILPIPLLAYGSFAIFGSWMIGILVAFLVSLIWVRHRIRPLYDPAMLKRVWRFSGVNYLTNFLILAPQTILTLMVVNLVSAETGAFFYIAWMIATVIFMIPNAVSKTLLAQGSNRIKGNIIKSLKFSFLLLIPAVAVILLLSKYLLLIFGEDYGAAAGLLRILAISSFPLSLNLVYVTVMNIKHRIGQVFIIHFVITGMTLLFSFFSIGNLTNIGYSWLASQVIVSVPVLFRLRRIIYE